MFIKTHALTRMVVKMFRIPSGKEKKQISHNKFYFFNYTFEVLSKRFIAVRCSHWPLLSPPPLRRMYPQINATDDEFIVKHHSFSKLQKKLNAARHTTK